MGVLTVIQIPRWRGRKKSRIRGRGGVITGIVVDAVVLCANPGIRLMICCDGIVELWKATVVLLVLQADAGSGER